jgi:hypothetical protein
MKRKSIRDYEQISSISSSTSRADFLVRNSTLSGFSPSLGLYQSVKELLENSIDATNNNTLTSLDTICSLKLIRSETSSTSFQLIVSDTGIGIPRESITSVITSIFSSSKGQGTNSLSSSTVTPTFGRYGVGLKAAILFAQEFGSLIAPLTVTTCTEKDNTICTGRYGIDSKNDTAIVRGFSLTPKEDVFSHSHGTSVSLEMILLEKNTVFSIALINSYLQRLVAFPMRNTALTIELVNLQLETKEPKQRRGVQVDIETETKRTEIKDTTTVILRAPRGSSPGFDLRSHFSSNFNVPIECISSAIAKRGEIGRRLPALTVQVFIILTPHSIQTRPINLTTLIEDARAAGNETATMHILRYANSIPLLSSSAECAITLGAISTARWAERFGISLSSLFASEASEEDVPRPIPRVKKTSSKKKEKEKAIPRRVVDELTRHPAAISGSSSLQWDTTKQDAEGAYVCRSSIADDLTISFSCLRIFINLIGPNLQFGDLKKTFVLDNIDKAQSLRCSQLVADAVEGALTSLRTQLPQTDISTVSSFVQASDIPSSLVRALPPQLFDSSREANLRLLKNVYLPSIAQNLVQILMQAGASTSPLWLSLKASLQKKISTTQALTEIIESPLPEVFQTSFYTTLFTKLTSTLTTCLHAQDEALVLSEIAEEEAKAEAQLLEVFASHSEAQAKSQSEEEKDPFFSFLKSLEKEEKTVNENDQLGDRYDDEEDEDDRKDDETRDSFIANEIEDRALESAILAIQTHQRKSIKRLKVTHSLVPQISSSSSSLNGIRVSIPSNDASKEVKEVEDEDNDNDDWSWIKK